MCFLKAIDCNSITWAKVREWEITSDLTSGSPVYELTSPQCQWIKALRHFSFQQNISDLSLEEYYGELYKSGKTLA